MPSFHSASIYTRLRALAAAARNNNCRTKGIMASPPAITTSLTQPTGLTNGYRISTANGSVIRSYGGVPTLNSNLRSMPCTTVISGGNISATRSATSWRHEVMADAIKVAVRLFGSTVPWRFLVNDQYVDLTGTLSADSTSNNQYIMLDFTSAGGKAIRKIAIEGEGAMGVDGFHVGATDSCFRTNGDVLRMIWIGDSYVANTAATRQNDGLTRVVGDALGVRDIWAAGIGSTGFIANTGTGGAYGTRLSDLTSNSPDIGVFATAANDKASSPAAIQAAVQAVIASVRGVASCSTIPLFFLGSWSNDSGPDANAIAAEGAVQAAVVASNDPNSFFVPICASTDGALITGTGSVATPSGSGNADIYIVSAGSGHPNTAGHNYLGLAIADRMMDAVLGIG